MFPIIGVLLQLLSVSFSSGESLLIGMIVSLAAFASATSLVLLRACRKLIKYDQEEIERLDKKAEAHQREQEDWGRAHRELALQLNRIRDLLNILCETDNPDTHEWCIEEVHKECEGLFIEAYALYKVLSQGERDLEQHLNGDAFNFGFYREWVSSLHERYVKWHQRHQAIIELETLEERLNRLADILGRVHGTRIKHWGDVEPRIPFVPDNHQDLADLCTYCVHAIQVRIWRLRENINSDLDVSISSVSELVERLERFHDRFDDNEESLFDLFVIAAIKENAKEQWQAVLDCAAETRSALVVEFLQESNRKYLQYFIHVSQILREQGPCAHRMAVVNYRSALSHWAASQALMLLLREKVGDEMTFARHARDLDSALQWRIQQDLPVFGVEFETFRATLESSNANFLL